MGRDGEIELDTAPVGKDFTAFLTHDKLPEHPRTYLAQGKSYEGIVDLKYTAAPPATATEIRNVRALICPCCSRQLFSGTFRHNDDGAVSGAAAPTGLPAIVVPPRESDNGDHTSMPFDLLVDRMHRLVFGDALPCDGLVVLSGTTKSGKTQISKGLVLRYLWTLRKTAKRFPHLVTYEDPVEDWCFSDGAGKHRLVPSRKLKMLDGDVSSWFADEHGIDFTPRQGGKQNNSDCRTLQQALREAKRQTPACFYVGEVRSGKDWNTVLEFAGSGHLIVVTTHAASLVETFSRILKAVHANTPALRRMVAAQIRACIHLQAVDWRLNDLPTVLSKTVRAPILPSLWLRKGQAVNALTGDGLASVCPNGTYVLSRGQFAEHLKMATWCTEAESIHDKIVNAGRDADMKELLG